jgi:hypothetical protein
VWGWFVWNEGKKDAPPLHGHGSIRYPAGSDCRGENKYGRRHGKGCLTLATGQVQHDGEWIDDVAVVAAKKVRRRKSRTDT